MGERIRPAGGAVLVANAERHFVAAVARRLRDLGWAAHPVDGASEALEQCARLRPQAVVTGLDGGDEDGFDFVRAVEARAAAAGLPRPAVLVCTRQAGLAALGPEVWALLGIDGVVERPCRLDAVDEALRRLQAPAAVADEPAEGDQAAPARACARPELAP